MKRVRESCAHTLPYLPCGPKANGSLPIRDVIALGRLFELPCETFACVGGLRWFDYAVILLAVTLLDGGPRKEGSL